MNTFFIFFFLIALVYFRHICNLPDEELDEIEPDPEAVRLWNMVVMQFLVCPEEADQTSISCTDQDHDA